MEALDALAQQYAWFMPLFAALLLALLAALVNWLGRRLLVRAIARLTRATPVQWDDAILARGVVHRIAHVLPTLVIYVGVALVTGLPPLLVAVTRNVALAYTVLTLALAVSGLLSAINDVYVTTERARTRPIKGYLQVAKIVVFVLAAVLVIAILVDRSPLLLLSGLGAMTAVLLLVFKDTILSLVASVQLTSNDMLRVGDWIEMPQLGADGDVIDVALHTVKVQNWDKTITTIPTHRLISESFRNWRGMQQSGGRRIKRAIHIDQSAIRYLDDDERERMKRVSLLADYIQRKRTELEEFNRELADQQLDPVNARRLTNIGTFRAYVLAYLGSHPHIHHGMTLMVRQLPPGPTGLPLEVYCFTDTVEWNAYEDIQSDIFDHLLAVLPEFGLRIFQQPAGSDLERGVSALAGRSAVAPASARLG